MSAAYLSQYSRCEILSIHGIEIDHYIDTDADCEFNNDETSMEKDCCSYCRGVGCNSCFALDF